MQILYFFGRFDASLYVNQSSPVRYMASLLRYPVTTLSDHAVAIYD